MRELFLYANLYHNFGFNITHIIPSYNEVNKPNKNKFKASSNDHSNLHYRKQTLEEIKSFDWEKATGIGAIMGFGKLRALDFDDCADISFVVEVLKLLGLPINYKWVSKTGSGKGFHIYLLAEEHKFPVKEDTTRAFKPNSSYNSFFHRMELRWEKHLVLPPSLSETYQLYQFINGIPLTPPTFVTISVLESLVNKFCFENGGFNTNIAPELYQPSYYGGGYLDMSPIYQPNNSEFFISGDAEYNYNGNYNSYDDYEPSYDKYGGAYGYDDDTIDNAFEGDPENYWNID